ncbi:hypothetical protein T06_4207 [Trichinella sp. T6]|nr:hypothetical protein T06_4207 [Trichinella sp. T6]
MTNWKWNLERLTCICCRLSVEEPPETDSAEDVLITPRTFNFESWTEQSPWTENVQSKRLAS